jgi:hypothetical protein
MVKKKLKKLKSAIFALRVDEPTGRFEFDQQNKEGVSDQKNVEMQGQTLRRALKKLPKRRTNRCLRVRVIEPARVGNTYSSQRHP